MTHEFEDIEVKINAPALLEDALGRKRKPCMIVIGSMWDPYLPIEEKLGLTRKCLETTQRHSFGATVLTKSARVLRDLDLLIAINAKRKCVVQMTMTTADNELCRIIGPNVSTTGVKGFICYAIGLTLRNGNR